MHRSFAPVTTLALLLIVAGSSAADEPNATLKLLFTGDIMLADLPGKAIERGVDPFAEFAPVFREADFVIGNLECVVATKGEPYDKPWTFRAHPRCVPILQKHFHAVSIANNHSGDFGREAFVEMLDLLSGKVPAFGGGRNKAQARKPVMLAKHGLRVALLGYNEFYPRAFAAGENHAGCAWQIEEEVLADIKAIRTANPADLILPFMHWGDEEEPKHDPRQRALAEKMFAAGACAIAGAHPHVVQPIETIDGKPVAYSLGNFVFDGFKEPEPKLGWLWRVTLDRRGVKSWDTVVIRLDEEGLPHLDKTTASHAGNRDGELPRRAAKTAFPE